MDKNDVGCKYRSFGLVEMSCGQGDNIFVSEDEVQDFQLNGYWVVSYPG